MSDLSAIFLFLFLIAAALMTVSLINSRQIKHKLIHQRLNQLKRRIVDLEETASSMEALTGSTRIERVIVDEIIDVLRGMQQLTKDTHTIDLQLESALNRAEELSAPGYHCQVNRVMNSDAKITRAQYLIGEAAIIIRKRQAANKIELSEMNAMIEDLAWAHLMVYVISLTTEGLKAASGGNILRGYNYYKKAQQALQESALDDERRHQFNQELSDIQANKRKSISRSLMPEVQDSPK